LTLRTLSSFCLSQSSPSSVTRFAAVGSQDLADGADRARRAVGHIPAPRAVDFQAFIQHRLGRDIGLLEGRGRVLAIGKEAHRPDHAAELEGFQLLRLQVLAENQFGGASADVHHQPPVGRARQQVGHPLVDQARFLAAGNHVDGKAQNLVRLAQEHIAVVGFAQGLRGHRADLFAPKARQTFAEARQAVPAALHRFQGEVVVVVEAVALADGFLEVFDALDLAVLILADFQAKAVGAEVKRCKTGAVAHDGESGERDSSFFHHRAFTERHGQKTVILHTVSAKRKTVTEMSRRVSKVPSAQGQSSARSLA
jgi:hypothetical protein